MVNIIILGCKGRMGQSILDLVKNDEEINIVGLVEATNSKFKGEKILENIEKYKDLAIVDNLEDVIDKTDVVIDFTVSSASIKNLEIIEKANKALILGTTGFSDEEKLKITNVSEHIACVFSPNMSIGVNVFFNLVKNAARILEGYNVEIVELHHNKKKDAPSGTALRLAECVCLERDNTEDSLVYGRKGMVGERNNNEIGIHAVRLGDVVGEHTVYFAGNNERLELTHRAHTRNNFAKGAVTAIKWIFQKPKGLYDMNNVLGLDK